MSVKFSSHIITQPPETNYLDLPLIYENSLKSKQYVFLTPEETSKQNIFNLNDKNYNQFSLSTKPYEITGDEFILNTANPDAYTDTANFFQYLKQLSINFFAENSTSNSDNITFSFQQIIDFNNSFYQEGNWFLKRSFFGLEYNPSKIEIKDFYYFEIPVGFIVNKIKGSKNIDAFIPEQKIFIFKTDGIANTNEEITITDFFDTQINGDGSFSYSVQQAFIYFVYKKEENGFSPAADILDHIEFKLKILDYEMSEAVSIPSKTQSSEYIPIPPNIPNVKINNYKNINNKVLILLNQNNGDFFGKANDITLFTEKQKLAFFIQALAYGIVDKDIIYTKSQDLEKFFLIYRTDTKPQFYSDIIIEENLIKTLDITKFEFSFEDKIKPNKKYYYCFRVEDLYRATSDTTLIYEIEMIDQSGTVYMTQTAFKPFTEPKFIKELNFENKVRIFPADSQINIPDNILVSKTIEQYDINGNKIGEKIIKQGFPSSELYPDDNIFNYKTFKIRVTSKNSKKKFDVNINYTLGGSTVLKLLKDAKNITTANFEILKTESL